MSHAKKKLTHWDGWHSLAEWRRSHIDPEQARINAEVRAERAMVLGQIIDLLHKVGYTTVEAILKTFDVRIGAEFDVLSDLRERAGDKTFSVYDPDEPMVAVRRLQASTPHQAAWFYADLRRIQSYTSLQMSPIRPVHRNMVIRGNSWRGLASVPLEFETAATPDGAIRITEAPANARHCLRGEREMDR